jgi:sucrose phosphorylase
MPIDPPFEQRLRQHLELLYGARASQCLDRILQLMQRYAPSIAPPRKPAWDERDVVLITYGDQVRQDGVSPLRTLDTFLETAGLSGLLSTVHLLPFFPYSSDDGFSVVDYREVDPALGDWSDVAALAERYDLMFDLVLNHVSRRSRWFAEYTAGTQPYINYFIEVAPGEDLSSVVRPRNLPLLAPVGTSRGTRHVWTTFSDDQIDLNYAEPDVLLEMLGVLLDYLAHGARMIRLDAIAYLWKRIGTTSIHLPQTHAVVKLLRDVVDAVAPGTILLTETNVPHAENISYFGQGDEAQMVYQFSLAPLLLEALLTGDASVLVAWLQGLEATPPGTTFFNFTASHDRIGVRPLEGLLPPERQQRLFAAVQARGGRISTRRNRDGTTSPYELNITYFSALSDPANPDPKRHVGRFLASQAFALGLRGIPGIYFHSLVATPNDREGVERTGRARSINRRKFELDELQASLRQPDGAPQMVLEGYRRLLAVRREQPAFHPEAPQEVVPLGQPSLAGFIRTSLDGKQRILVLANVGPQTQEVDCAAVGLHPQGNLQVPAGSHATGDIVQLAPYEVAWLIV